MPEQHVYELEVRIRASNQPDSVIHREIVTDKATTSEALGEVWVGVSNDVKAKCRGVEDQG